MISLQGVSKIYFSKGEGQIALDGLSFDLPDKGLIAISGPSGCGKTTLLNIISGLVSISEGTLTINGTDVSTFKKKQWNSFRNQHIGFIFQNYYLTAFQTVLENVETGLLINGIRKKKRREMARQALKIVGLTEKEKNYPNELSGGQKQRVAIARAIANKPEIILADEPTGALDKENSRNVMNILKLLSQNCLVVIVSHNEELVKEYADRIITLDEKSVKSDVSNGKEIYSTNKELKFKKTSLSFFSKNHLAVRNLLQQKVTTLLVCVSLAIGVFLMGIILAGGKSICDYLLNQQADYIANSPVTISKQVYSLEMGVLDANFLSASENDVSSFLKSLSKQKLRYDLVKDYGINWQLYLKRNEKYVEINNNNEGNENVLFYQSLSNETMAKHCQLICGDWVKSYDECLLIINKQASEELLNNLGISEFNQDEIMKLELKLLLPVDLYQYDDKHSIWVSGSDEIINESLSLKVCGIAVIEQEMDYLKEGFVYSEKLFDYLHKTVTNKEIIQQQLNDLDRDVFSGELFEKLNSGEYQALGLADLLNINEKLVAESFSLNVDYNKTRKLLEEYLEKCEKIDNCDFVLSQLNFQLEIVLNSFIDNGSGKYDLVDLNKISSSLEIFDLNITKELLSNYYYTWSNNGFDYVTIKKENLSQMIMEIINLKDNQIIVNQLIEQYNNLEKEGYLNITTSSLLSLFASSLKVDGNKMLESFETSYSQQDLYEVLSTLMNREGSNYETNLEKLGYFNKAEPISCDFYFQNVNEKDEFISFIENYNETNEEIVYSDIYGLISNTIMSITNLLMVFTGGLIIITTFSSTLLSGIVRYYVVLKRTSELGLLRALGASDRDIKALLNRESLIIGFISSLIGIGLVKLVEMKISGANLLIENGVVVSLASSYEIALILINTLLCLASGRVSVKKIIKKEINNCLSYE